ncbi:RDD family protein [Nocardia sp. CC201C]|uniref:RDD family protein n=1 Tax=Nocardia sp. CC201C TaxID=3044575 RepID=UPI0024A7C313|nr:RDD family protein [Nocardia sp. CC201C]
MAYEAAPFFRRLAARILDLAFCLVLTFVVAIPVSILWIPIGLMTEGVGEDIVYGLGAALCYFIAYVGLEVFLLVRRKGQTLGKGLLGLRVVPTAESVVPRIGLGSAVIRMLIIFLPFVFLSLSGNFPESSILNALAILGLLSFAVSLVLAAIPTARRQALHDLAAGSRVVRAAKRKIDLKTDLVMVLPGKVSMTKLP